MHSTPHPTGSRHKRTKPTPRNKKLANGAIIGMSALLALGLGAAFVQDERAQARSTEAVASYKPPVEGQAIVAPKRVLIIGDSYTAGSNEGGRDEANWTEIVGTLVDAEVPVDYESLGLGGSGYIAKGTSGKTFLDGAKQIVHPNTDVVVIFGSLNDAENAGRVEAAATEVYEYIETTAPNAKLIVVGPPIPYDEPTTNDREIAAEIRRASEGHADSYVDPIADDWFDDEKIIGGDGVHPTDEGHQVIAEQLAPVLTEALA